MDVETQQSKLVEPEHFHATHSGNDCKRQLLKTVSAITNVQMKPRIRPEENELTYDSTSEQVGLHLTRRQI